MGSILANLIADAGADIALIDANAESLQKLATTIDGSHAVPGDLSNEEGCKDAIESGKKEAYFGYPESIFARINGLLPGLVDNGTKAQNRIARSFAKPG
jgi:NAD(P)-dependent dehydrogenase (short-subunit alcohol dehydrogenase family)